MPASPPTRSGGPLARLAVTAVMAAVVVAGCGNSGDDSGQKAEGGGEEVATVDSPGVTDEEIRFAAFGTDSNNPLGTCVLECYTQGIEAYFAYRNSQGGVHGRDLVLTTKLDDELGNNKDKALEIVSANDTFAAFSAAQIASGFADIAEAGIPLYNWGIAPKEEAGREAIFPYPPVLCATCPSRFNAYPARLKGAKRIGVLGYGVSEVSKEAAQGARASIETYSDELDGAEVVYFNDGIQFGMPNGVGPEVTAMKQAGVDMVFATVDLNGMKTLASELKRQGMGDVPMLHPNTYEQSFVKDAGDLFEGDIVLVLFRPFEADSAGSALDTFKQWMRKADAPITELAMYGWINADTAYQGLVAAGENFNRAKVIAATNEIEDYTAGGLVPPIDWGRQHDAPTLADPATHGNDPDCQAYVEVEDGEFVIVGDPAEPFQCWPGDTRDWSEPEPTNFEADG